VALVVQVDATAPGARLLDGFTCAVLDGVGVAAEPDRLARPVSAAARLTHLWTGQGRLIRNARIPLGSQATPANTSRVASLLTGLGLGTVGGEAADTVGERRDASHGPSR
jgi:hypothetical protein